jgi:hypothetical protein
MLTFFIDSYILNYDINKFMQHKIQLIVSLLFILLVSNKIEAQNNVTARIRVNSGDNIDFLLRTFNDLQNGKSLDTWTTIYIYFNDTVLGPNPNGIGSGWKLDFEADAANFVGIESNTLPLAVLELKASGPANGPDGEIITYSAEKELQLLPQTLILGNNQTDGTKPYSDNFYISYYCGQQISVNGESV